MRQFLVVLLIVLTNITILKAQHANELDLGIWGLFINSENSTVIFDPNATYQDENYASNPSSLNWSNELRDWKRLNANHIIAHIPANIQKKVIKTADTAGITVSVSHDPTYSRNYSNYHYQRISSDLQFWIRYGDDDKFNGGYNAGWRATMDTLVDSLVSEYKNLSGTGYFYAIQECVVDDRDGCSVDARDVRKKWNAMTTTIDSLNKHNVKIFGSDGFGDGGTPYKYGDTLTIREFTEGYLDDVDKYMMYDYPFDTDTSSSPQKNLREVVIERVYEPASRAIVNNSSVSTRWVTAIQTQQEPNVNLRAPKQREIRAQAYLALSYGAKGIYSYVYDSHEGKSIYGLVNDKREPYSENFNNDHPDGSFRYDYVKQLYANLDSISIVANLNWENHFVNSSIPSDNIPNIISINSGNIDTNDVDVGVFEDNSGNPYFLVVNRNIEDSAKFNLSPKVEIRGDKTLRRVSSDTRIYSHYNSSSNSTTFKVPLKAGEGKLFEVENSPLNNGGQAVYSGHDKIRVQDHIDFAADSVIIRSSHQISFDGGSSFSSPDSTILVRGTIKTGKNVTGNFKVDSKLEIAGDIDINASTSNFTTFERSSSGDRWDGLVLKGDNPDIDGLKVHDAKKGIRAFGVTDARITDCKLTYNDNGLYIDQDAGGSATNNFTLRNCLIKYIEHDGVRVQGGSDLTMIRVTVKASSDYGIYLSNANMLSDSSIVEGNDPNGNYAGVYLTTGTDVVLEYDEGRNRIANNGSHEIYAESEFGSFIAHIPCDEAVPNSIFDSNDDSDDFEFYAVNQDDDQTIILDHVWWENEDPVSGHFYWYSDGYISRDNPIYQTSDPTSGVGYQASTERVDYPELELVAKGSASRDGAPHISQHNDFKHLVEGLFTKLREHPNSSRTPHRLNRLYTLIVGLDEFHSLDKRDELREQLATWRERLAKIHDSNKDYPQIRRKVIQDAGETAVVRGMLLAQEESNLSKSARIANTYGDYIKSPRGKRGYQLARTYGHKSRGQYEKALAAADAYRDINISLPKGISDHAPHVYKRLKHSIELLKAESASGGTSAQKQVAGKNSQTPDKYTLRSNYPNPFNPSTTIRYALPKETHVTIRVYNIMGRRVATLVDSRKEAGRYNVQFNASNLASGVYIYRIQAGSFTKSKKMLLIK